MRHVDGASWEREQADLVRALVVARGARVLASTPDWRMAYARTVEERRLARVPIYLFTGKRQARSAWAVGAPWYNDRPHERIVQRTLTWVGVELARRLYTNLWRVPGRGRSEHDESHRVLVCRAGAEGLVVALGGRAAARTAL